MILVHGQKRNHLWWTKCLKKIFTEFMVICLKIMSLSLLAQCQMLILVFEYFHICFTSYFPGSSPILLILNTQLQPEYLFFKLFLLPLSEFSCQECQTVSISISIFISIHTHTYTYHHLATSEFFLWDSKLPMIVVSFSNSFLWIHRPNPEQFRPLGTWQVHLKFSYFEKIQEYFQSSLRFSALVFCKCWQMLLTS